VTAEPSELAPGRDIEVQAGEGFHTKEYRMATAELEPEVETTQETPVVESSEAVEVENIGRQDPASDIDTTTMEGSLLAKIKQKEQIVGDKLREYNSLKADAKEAKKEYDELVLELRSLIRSAGERLPLFDGPRETSAVETAAATAQPVNDAWRAVSIDELEMPKRVRKALAKAELTTIGKLEDQRGSDSLHGGLRNIEGIGPEYADQLEQSLLDWLTKNRDSAIFNAPEPELEIMGIKVTPAQAKKLANNAKGISELVGENS
jgi:hypothetical protein